ncbi:peptidase [Oscillibacter valericigenes]|uniref:transglutaminase domain-containing protein n=1 Tax=Oscillibacter valericigenes TaxID=351091 RepID=UPI001F4092DD|nr:transglutaminase domain-containing protein [Oscillibacter valericigenes]MCF2616887.1 peptidase [Oscillibacter valericigenes]
MEAYYYQHLPKPQQAAYHAMKTGFAALSPGFSVPRLENRELSDIFFRLRLDCPEIFYVTGFTYRFTPGAENVELLPEYLFDKAKIRDHQKALASRVDKLARPAMNMTASEKERYIHDFICQNVRYDKLKKPYSHEIIGPLGQGVGVCEGIAKSVKILCDALGLWCIIAVSEANPDQGVKYRHAWNILKLDGQYVHLDATFDNSLGHDGVIRYDYFNLDDKRLFRDHQPVIYPVPACAASDRFYYREAKLSFTKVEDVVKRAQMAIRKGLPFVFHWRGGPFTREVLIQLVQALEEAAQKRNRHAAVSYNRPQAVLQVHFPAKLPQEAAAEEEANEGEQYEGE